MDWLALIRKKDQKNPGLSVINHFEKSENKKCYNGILLKNRKVCVVKG